MNNPRSIGFMDIDDVLIIDAGGMILVRGWCLVNESELTAAGEACIDGKKIANIEFGKSRPDVQAAFPHYEYGEKSGFSAWIPAGSLHGKYTLGIKGFTDSGENHYLEKQVEIYDPFRGLDKRDRALFSSFKKYMPPHGFPLQAYVEVTTACNLACIMCRYDVVTKNVPTNLLLKKELFFKLKPIFPRLRVMHLVGWGEPTLHKSYPDFIREVRNANPSCGIDFTSHFNLISDELIDALIDYKVTSINISIDGATREVYEKIRIKGSFDALLKNIAKLKRKKLQEQTDIPVLTYEFVVQKANIHELPQFIQFIYELGGRHITLEHVGGMPHLEINYSEHRQTFEEAMRKAKELGICVVGSACACFANTTAAEKEDGENRESKIICFEPFQTLYVNPDGRITPCCLNETVLGNLYENTIAGIWFGEPYTLFRKRMIECNYDADCKDCISQSKAVPSIVNG
ncbi:MAG: radical SAM protein [Gammaproteobacteria bacterium]|nr:radical SAM protein [Gammaproteobacteria bacterium]